MAAAFFLLSWAFRIFLAEALSNKLDPGKRLALRLRVPWY